LKKAASLFGGSSLRRTTLKCKAQIIRPLQRRKKKELEKDAEGKEAKVIRAAKTHIRWHPPISAPGKRSKERKKKGVEPED